MSFREIEQAMLEDLKRKKNTVLLSITQIEQSLAEPPFVSDIDYEGIQFEAENDIVRFDLWEREREKGETQYGIFLKSMERRFPKG